MQFNTAISFLYKPILIHVRFLVIFYFSGGGGVKSPEAARMRFLKSPPPIQFLAAPPSFCDRTRRRCPAFPCEVGVRRSERFPFVRFMVLMMVMGEAGVTPTMISDDDGDDDDNQ